MSCTLGRATRTSPGRSRSAIISGCAARRWPTTTPPTGAHRDAGWQWAGHHGRRRAGVEAQMKARFGHAPRRRGPGPQRDGPRDVGRQAQMFVRLGRRCGLSSAAYAGHGRTSTEHLPATRQVCHWPCQLIWLRVDRVRREPLIIRSLGFSRWLLERIAVEDGRMSCCSSGMAEPRTPRRRCRTRLAAVWPRRVVLSVNGARAA